MRIIKRSLAVFLSIVLLFSILVFQLNPVSADSKSTIIGSGPIYGDTLFPFAGTYYKDSLYIQDAYGVSSFDAETLKFDKRFPVQSSVGMLSNLDFIDFLRIFSSGDSSADITNPVDMPQNHTIQPSLGITSDGECIIAEDSSSFGVYNIDSGEKIRSLSVPEFSHTFENCSSFKHFQVLNDTIYILGIIVEDQEEVYITKSQVYHLEFISMDKNGENIQHVLLDDCVSGFEETAMFASLILLRSFSISPGESKLAFLFGSKLIIASNNGAILAEKDFSDSDDFLNLISFYDENTLYTSGLNIDSILALEGCSITSYKLNEEASTIKKLDIIKVDESGFAPVYLNCHDNVTTMITSGMMKDLFQYKAICIKDEKSNLVGKYPNADGQICGSIAFTVDSNNKLYQTNLGANKINVFDSDGKFEKSIPIDLSVVSSIMGMIEFCPLMLDMDVDENYLYLSNAFLIMSFSISRYSFETEEWELVYCEDSFDSTPISPAISINVFEESIFCLNLGVKENLYPIVNLIDDFGELTEANFTFESSDYSPEELPMWIDMKYDTEEELIYLLDSANNTILVFDADEDLQTVITLTQPEKDKDKIVPFYSSLELCEDLLYITDVENNKLCVFDMEGTLIDTFGKSGSPKIATTKEAYKENADVFYGAWKIKLAKSHTSKDDPLYVSDFGNCRFHKIHLAHDPDHPEISFPEQAFVFSDFYVSESKSKIIPGSIIPEDGTISFKMNADVEWISFPKESGIFPSDSLEYIIHGDKLKCWDKNEGDVIIEFPDFPSNNQQFHIVVNAIGNIVEIQIGSNKAYINTEEYVLDDGSIPVISNGRTYVAIRFLSEKVFNATVEWNGEERSVTFFKDDLTVKLFVGKNTAIVNEKEVTLDSPPIIIEGRTLVPLRFVGENLGASIEWDGKTQTVTMYYPGK